MIIRLLPVPYAYTFSSARGLAGGPSKVPKRILRATLNSSAPPEPNPSWFHVCEGIESLLRAAHSARDSEQAQAKIGDSFLQQKFESDYYDISYFNLSWLLVDLPALTGSRPRLTTPFYRLKCALVLGIDINNKEETLDHRVSVIAQGFQTHGLHSQPPTFETIEDSWISRRLRPTVLSWLESSLRLVVSSRDNSSKRSTPGLLIAKGCHVLLHIEFTIIEPPVNDRQFLTLLHSRSGRVQVRNIITLARQIHARHP
ncbi:hypothetical protein WG66_006546 [Moniliophthora roreri]|nr:hypothetical protein WG66_006546 [Moniliophthora roreri]